MIRGKYKSRKNMKRAMRLKQFGHEGFTEPSEFIGRMLGGIVETLRQKFGSSKHRAARVQRFKARQGKK